MADITFLCPHCGTSLTVPEAYAGKSGTCKGCGARIVAPARGPEPVVPAPPAAQTPAPTTASPPPSPEIRPRAARPIPQAARRAPATVLGVPKAGFWIRFAAGLIDWIILSLLGAALRAIAGGAAGTQMGTLLLIAYSVLLIGGPGQTVGMMVLGIMVVATDGSKAGYLRAFIRWLGSILSALVLYLGFLWIAWDPQKQAWHNKIAGTYVVKA
jgi:uncharacterized RDD family membrane protein YckC